MKLGLRAQICSQCRPAATVAGLVQLPAPHSCEGGCALFVQLPRLARFLERHCAKPPAGYEEFVFKLLGEAATESAGGDGNVAGGSFLEYTPEALAILERVVALLEEPVVANPKHDCARQSLALGQLSVHAAKNDASEPQS